VVILASIQWGQDLTCGHGCRKVSETTTTTRPGTLDEYWSAVGGSGEVKREEKKMMRSSQETNWTPTMALQRPCDDIWKELVFHARGMT
jgi:hypothetical protein